MGFSSMSVFSIVFDHESASFNGYLVKVSSYKRENYGMTPNPSCKFHIQNSMENGERQNACCEGLFKVSVWTYSPGNVCILHACI